MYAFVKRDGEAKVSYRLQTRRTTFRSLRSRKLKIWMIISIGSSVERSMAVIVSKYDDLSLWSCFYLTANRLEIQYGSVSTLFDEKAWRFRIGDETMAYK